MQPHAKSVGLGCDRLEERLPLAGLFAYTDIDGDLVTLKSSKGGDAELAAAVTLSAGTSGQLQSVNLATNPIFAGTNLTLTVKKAGGGDGLAAVGHIDATNVDLGKISIQGDVGRIVAGDTTPTTTGVVSLTVMSLGRYGTTTGAPNLASTIRGDLKALVVKGDVQQARVTMIGGGIGKLTIGGSLVGGAADDSGRISSDTIGAIKVGISIVGAGGMRSASISSADVIASVTVGNSILGGDGEASGLVYAKNVIGSLKVARDILGGNGIKSGGVAIESLNPNTAGIGNVTIGGSIGGGDGKDSGAIYGVGGTGAPSVRIGGDLRGGVGDQSGIVLTRTTKTISLGGSLLGGSGLFSGVMGSLGSMGTASVQGSIVGGSGGASGSLMQMSAGGRIRAVVVSGSLTGGSGELSGKISNETGTTDRVMIRGSITGGSGNFGSGIIFGEKLGLVSVGGNVTGGAGSRSGSIAANVLKRVVIKGSLTGGAGETSSCLLGVAEVGTVSVGQNVVGGLGKLSGSVLSPGGSIAKATVGGSVIGGAGAGSATIGAARNLASLLIKGGIAGTSAMFPTQVLAGGVQGGSGIGSVTIGGAVASTVFLAGWEIDSTDGIANPVNGNASIGKILVKGGFGTSSIAAGVNSPVFPRFGTQVDTTIPGGTACSIGSVVIRGQATGSGDATQSFGIVSRTIGSVKVKGVSLAIPAANTSTPIGSSGNFVIRVISV